MKGDLVDELLAKYINMTKCPVPIKRLGNGYYLFGTKKIYAKIMNGKLVIRVGGGFMTIEEFIDNYSDAEMLKVKNADNNSVDDSQSSNKIKGIGAGYNSNRKSPRNGGSPKSNTDIKKN
jgi:hypothetical protein